MSVAPELLDAVVHARAELRTIHINRDVFTTAAATPLLAGTAEKLRHALIDRWLRGTEVQA